MFRNLVIIYKILVILCLSLVSTSFQLDPTCGNGFLEVGEECDCTTQQDCNHVGNTCCRNCKFVARGTICRDAVNLCDVPEYCSGTSAVCAADLVTANGVSCKNDTGYCYKGECRTHDEQCTELWNGGAFKAVDACYEVYNRREDENGYCKQISNTSYLPCKLKNVLCGKLWCIGNNKITPKDHGYNYRWTAATVNNRRNFCRSVQMFQGPGKLPLGPVLDGTKCGREMVCKKNECVSLADAYWRQPTCVNNCNGNGVCNENGNCHCNPGWKCPNCAEAYDGPGGSIDNGLSCQAATTLPATIQPQTTTIPATTQPPATTAPIPPTTAPPTTSATSSTTKPAETPRIITQTGQSSNDKISMKILIPLVIVSVCFLFLLAVSIYCYTNQCRFRQNTNGQPNHIPEAHLNEASFVSTQEPADEEYYSYPNDDVLYETPIEVSQSMLIAQNGAESIPQISTGLQSPGTSANRHYSRAINKPDKYEFVIFV